MREPSRNSGTCGPGTFVTTRLNGSARAAMREASDRTVDGVHSPTWVRTSAPAACLASFRCDVVARMRSSRARGARSSSGIGTIQAETRLPSAPRSSFVRTLTGAITRKSSVSQLTSWRSRKRRRAPATVASTTSFSVPPSRSLTALISAMFIWCQSKRRCGPTGWFSGVSERPKPEPTISRIARRRVRRSESGSCVWLTRSEIALPISNGSFATDAAVSSIRSSSLGAGRGMYFSPGAKPSSGFAVSSTFSRSTLETPSTMQWWILLIIAKRFPSSRPSMIQISQSGFERSRCCDMMRAASRLSCRSSPGRGSAVWRTW